MKKKEVLFALVKYIVDISVVAFILFFSAGEFFESGMILVVSLMVVGLAYGSYMFRSHPQLMSKRLNDRESGYVQYIVIGTSLFVLCGSLLVAGLTIRYDWLMLPRLRYVIGLLLFVFGAILLISVIRVNEYLSPAIKTENQQEVVKTGPYGFVRHPMYLAIGLLLVSAELVLGSVYALLIFLVFIPVAMLRIVDEERLLTRELKGYDTYKSEVKYRLIPFIW